MSSPCPGLLTYAQAHPPAHPPMAAWAGMGQAPSPHAMAPEPFATAAMTERTRGLCEPQSGHEADPAEDMGRSWSKRAWHTGQTYS